MIIGFGVFVCLFVFSLNLLFHLQKDNEDNALISNMESLKIVSSLLQVGICTYIRTYVCMYGSGFLK